MISCYLQGGLGNYMFQIATTFSLSKDYGFNCAFNSKNYLKVHKGIENYRNNIFRNVNFDEKLTYNEIYNEPSFNYEKIKINDNTLLKGYYQTEKYFLHNRNEILNLYTPSKKDLDYIKQKYGKILKNETCSIHIRRGDYLNLQTYHPLCTMHYYNNAITDVGEDNLFLVFSDDIEWCKENLKGQNFVFIENEKDYIDLYIMSMCNNNIIANSSFSWWGAWLNDNKNKIVTIPSLWFGPAKGNTPTKDIYSEGWVKI